jgi:hypothetical protein
MNVLAQKNQLGLTVLLHEAEHCFMKLWNSWSCCVPFTFGRCALVLSLGLLGSACNSGRWVDGDPVISQALCDSKQMEQIAKDPASSGFIKLDAQAICRHAGLAYTGDTRCEGGSGQVKCK